MCVYLYVTSRSDPSFFCQPVSVCVSVCVCVRLCLVRACMAHVHYECALCIYVCSRMYVNMRTCVYVYVTCNDTDQYWV